MPRLSSPRPTLNQTFFDIARAWAKRSTCEHLAVGAVIARDSRTIASGYNGAPPGLPHCRHDLETIRIRCSNTNHAEGNALAFAARYGIATDGASLYTTHSPCVSCAGLIISAGIVVVRYLDLYTTDGLGVAGRIRLQSAGVMTVFGENGMEDEDQ